jgi:MraZ protein
LDGVNQFATADHPRGTYSARVDDKGRLKLPADFHKYLTEIGAVKVFVTSFDKRIGKIYPIPVWKEIEIKLEAGNGNGRKGKALLFVANDLGGDAEIDGQGRMLIPAELRRELKLENEQVRLKYYRGGIEFQNSGVYEEEKRRTEQEAAEALRIFEDDGTL